MIDDSMSILKFIIPKAHICFYICSQIKYYLKKNYLYYYFIILFLEFANCFQLFISSIPIYVVHESRAKPHWAKPHSDQTPSGKTPLRHNPTHLY